VKSRWLLRKLRHSGALLLSIFLTWGPLSAAWAVDTADVLPANIRSLSIKAGTLLGLNELYTSSGRLSYLSTVNSVDLDVNALGQFDARVLQLQTVLNQFGAFNLGDQLHVGRLTIDADPSINYMAPMFLYGYSKKLTFGLAVPIVTYRNRVDVSHVGGNVKQLQQQFGHVDPELNAGFVELDQDMKKAFHQKLREKGYAPLTNVNDEFIGDVQLISAYQWRREQGWAHTTQFYLGLPTGPKPDDNSLTDLENFGRWTLRPMWVSQYHQDAKSSWIGSIAYQAVLPMSATRRVPLHADDTLPGVDQRMNLKWDVGDSWTLGFSRTNKINEVYSAAVGYSYEQKWHDRYAGAPGGREIFLEADSNRTAHVGKLEITYSSINNYLNKKALIPGTIIYEMSKVFAGQNTENQFKHEVWLSVYF